MNIWFLGFVVLAEIIGTVAGFGSSTVLLPVALLFFGFGDALVLVAFVHIVGNIAKMGWFRKQIDGHLFFNFGIPSVLASVLGAYLVSYFSVDVLKILLGLFLVGYAWLGWKEKGFKAKGNGGVLMIGGTLSGFLAGLIGTGGALRGAFLSAYGLKKEKYIATMAMIAVLVDLARLPVYLRQGLLTQEYFVYLPVLALLAVIGATLGTLIVKRVSQEHFKKIVLVGLFLIGVKLVFGL